MLYPWSPKRKPNTNKNRTKQNNPPTKTPPKSNTNTTTKQQNKRQRAGGRKGRGERQGRQLGEPKDHQEHLDSHGTSINNTKATKTNKTQPNPRTQHNNRQNQAQDPKQHEQNKNPHLRQWYQSYATLTDHAILLVISRPRSGGMPRRDVQRSTPTYGLPPRIFCFRHLHPSPHKFYVCHSLPRPHKTSA